MNNDYKFDDSDFREEELFQKFLEQKYNNTEAKKSSGVKLADTRTPKRSETGELKTDYSEASGKKTKPSGLGFFKNLGERKSTDIDTAKKIRPATPKTNASIPGFDADEIFRQIVSQNYEQAESEEYSPVPEENSVQTNDGTTYSEEIKNNDASEPITQPHTDTLSHEAVQPQAEPTMEVQTQTTTEAVVETPERVTEEAHAGTQVDTQEENDNPGNYAPLLEIPDSNREITDIKDFLPTLPQGDGKWTQKILILLKNVSHKDLARQLCIFVIPAFLALFLALNILTPSSGMSKKENRALARFPRISISSITNGTFMKEFETFISDQFVFRNHFVASKRRYEVLSGKEQNHGILMCDDGYLIENTSELTWSNVNSNIEGINTLAKIKRYNVSVAIVPTAYEIMKDKLPFNAYVNSYDTLTKELGEKIRNATITDAKPLLENHKDEYLYYYSDHHQTANGSYWLYVALANKLGYEPYDIDDFKIEKMADKFKGTQWSNSGFARAKEDIIYKYTLKEGNGASVDFPAEEESLETLYNKDTLSQKDKYMFYLDGNHSVAEVKSQCGTGKKLAIIKDSYAHSLVPFLANHYSEIYLVDLRYFTEDVFKYLYSCNVEDVLVLYNQNTFMTDNNLAKLTDYAKTSSFVNVPKVKYGLVDEHEKVDMSYFDDAVFVGDSLTIGIQNFSGFNSTFLCMGGLNTRNLESLELPNKKTVLNSIETAEHMGKVYIMLGTNEIAYGDPDGFIKRYGDFIDKMRASFPDAIVYIQSIMPVTRHVSETTSIKRDRIIDCNERLLKLAEEKQCYYIDLHSHFNDGNGYLPDDIGSDGIHLGPVKYKELADYLQTHAIPERTFSRKDDGDSKAVAFKGKGTADTEKIAEDILSSIEFKDNLTPVGNTLIISNYKIDPAKICSAVVYMGGGSTAEEIAVFEAESESEAKKIEKLAKERIDRKKLDYENYMPAEMAKLNSPVIVRDGNVVAVCIADKVSDGDIKKCIK